MANKKARRGYIGFRCSEALQERLENLCDALNTDVSDYMRTVTEKSVENRERRLRAAGLIPAKLSHETLTALTEAAGGRDVDQFITELLEQDD